MNPIIESVITGAPPVSKHREPEDANLPAGDLFSLGRVVITYGAQCELQGANLGYYLDQHSRGNWGNLGPEGKRANDNALSRDPATRCRILSAYEQPPYPKFWIITEWNRSVTTILLPSEY